MGIFRNIWNTLFGKSKIEETTEVVEVEEPKLKVVHKKKKQVAGAIYLGKEVKPKDKKTIGAYNTEDTNFNANPVITPLPNGDDFFVSNELISKEEKSDAKFEFPVQKGKRKSNKKIIGQKTLSDIKEYLIKYGSLDVLTCEQIFKVKSLHNFIWQLRKEGLKIKTDKVGLHNELGQKIEVTNYRLISKK
jgi:hypothetical protein